jgi:hypothetical protein
LSVNAAQSRVVQCWHILPDILSSSTVSSREVVFPLLLFELFLLAIVEFFLSIFYYVLDASLSHCRCIRVL